MVDVVVPDLGDRRGVAVAHAGRAHDADLRRIETVPQRREQLPAAHQLAGQAVADPDVSGGGGVSPSLTTSKWA